MAKEDRNLAIDKIRALKGFDELKQLAEEWQRVASNLDQLPKKTGLLPNCLFSVHPGTVTPAILDLLVQFLEENQLLQFVGVTKVVRFVLDFSPELSRFPAFPRLIETFRDAAGFRGSYKGLACIDISEWLNDLHDLRFLRFLEYCADYRDDVLFIFFIPPAEAEMTKEVEAVLLPFFRLRHLKLTFANTRELYHYVQDCLQEQGFAVDEKAASALKEIIADISKLRSFKGHHTLNQLASNIIYEKCCRERLTEKTITIQDLGLLGPDGPWNKQARRQKAPYTRKLGFNMETKPEEWRRSRC